MKKRTLARFLWGTLLLYLIGYFVLRDYASHHAPSALTRNLTHWPPWEPRIVHIKNSRILWLRFYPRTLSSWDKYSHEWLEPAVYYMFAPLVEIDCALNGHPADREYDWKFFGSNSE
jgi:hypothetical protein